MFRRSRNKAESLKRELGLEFLPGESGFLKKVARSKIEVTQEGQPNPLRASGLVYYLLDRDQNVNYLHWLSPDDTHVLCEGGPVDYYVFFADGTARHYVLGRSLRKGEQLALMIPGGSWKALKLCRGVDFALMANILTPEWTRDRVKVGAGREFIDQYKGQAPWATPAFLKELIGPNFIQPDSPPSPD